MLYGYAGFKGCILAYFHSSDLLEIPEVSSEGRDSAFTVPSIALWVLFGSVDLHKGPSRRVGSPKVVVCHSHSLFG